jgi:carbon starvation protein
MNVDLYLSLNTFNGTLMAVLSVILIIMVVAILADSIRVWLKLFKTDKPVGMNTEVPIVCQYGETRPTITP